MINAPMKIIKMCALIKCSDVKYDPPPPQSEGAIDQQKHRWCLKGTLARDFLRLVFFHESIVTPNIFSKNFWFSRRYSGNKVFFVAISGYCYPEYGWFPGNNTRQLWKVNDFLFTDGWISGKKLEIF